MCRTNEDPNRTDNTNPESFDMFLVKSSKLGLKKGRSKKAIFFKSVGTNSFTPLKNL
jgi:hypothetical protein